MSNVEAYRPKIIACEIVFDDVALVKMSKEEIDKLMCDVFTLGTQALKKGLTVNIDNPNKMIIFKEQSHE